MIFLMMLSVILLYILMILPAALNMIRYISDLWCNNQNWLLNFNKIYKTLWNAAGSGLLISMLAKLN